MDEDFEVCDIYRPEKDDFKKVGIATEMMMFLNEIGNARERCIW